MTGLTPIPRIGPRPIGPRRFLDAKPPNGGLHVIVVGVSVVAEFLFGDPVAMLRIFQGHSVRAQLNGFPSSRHRDMAFGFPQLFAKIIPSGPVLMTEPVDQAVGYSHVQQQTGGITAIVGVRVQSFACNCSNRIHRDSQRSNFP
jgi:hypothetical protein